MTTVALLIDGVVVVSAVPPLVASVYLAACALLSRRASTPAARSDKRFDVLVPAHDESGTIEATVASLLAMDYPRERFRVIVVADNCTDDTAARARLAGAEVLERSDTERRGKGYALAHGFGASLADGVADAVVVVDADTLVSPNLLGAAAARLAEGLEAMQAEYGVRNPDDAWRTRLMHLAFTLFHTVRSRARERLALSCGLRGNGMVFSSALLRRIPPEAFSLTEDVEYGIALGLGGVRVAYMDEATVRGEMPATAVAARTQRERWETGRWRLIRTHLPRLLSAWRRGGGRVPFDLAADLVIPPLTTLAAVDLLGLIASVAVVWSGGTPGIVLPWLVASLALFAYVARGVAAAGLGARGVLDIAWIPVYAVWKISLTKSPARRSDVWVRTMRAYDK